MSIVPATVVEELLTSEDHANANCFLEKISTLSDVPEQILAMFYGENRIMNICNNFRAHLTDAILSLLIESGCDSKKKFEIEIEKFAQAYISIYSMQHGDFDEFPKLKGQYQNYYAIYDHYEKEKKRFSVTTRVRKPVDGDDTEELQAVELYHKLEKKRSKFTLQIRKKFLDIIHFQQLSAGI